MKTDEQTALRVKVAELLGVKCARCKGTGEYLRYGPHDWFRRGNGGTQQPVKCDHVTYDHQRPYQTLPDYLNDLNACAEMEATIPEESEQTYFDHLHDICDEFPGTLIYRATATQRCHAFIATMEASK